MSSSAYIRPSIVLLGDSITQQAFGNLSSNVAYGWGSLLASSYQRRADVFARGYYGYNTEHALEVLPRVLEPLSSSSTGHNTTHCNTLFCTILFGSNDAVDAGELQHVPLEQYRANMRRIVSLVRGQTQFSRCPIILMTPPPVHEPSWAAFKGVEVSTRKNANMYKYGQLIKELGAELDCEVIDTWTVLGGDLGERAKQNLTDGVHLSESGNRLLYEAVMELLKEKFPDLAPMDDSDGEGKYGKSGIPVQEKLWTEMC